MGEMPYCYDEDGSFCWKVFFAAAQVRWSLLMIAGGLAASVLVTRIEAEDGFVTMALPLLCCFFCLFGAERLNTFLSRQRAMKEEREKGGRK